jgi:hypothetical protein
MPNQSERSERTEIVLELLVQSLLLVLVDLYDKLVIELDMMVGC